MKNILVLLLFVVAGFQYQVTNAQQAVVLKSTSNGVANNQQYPLKTAATIPYDSPQSTDTYQQYQASVIPAANGSKYVVLASSPKSSNPLYPKTYTKSGDNAIIYYNENGKVSRKVNSPSKQQRRIKYYVDGIPQYE